jgi:hypothetical protein
VARSSPRFAAQDICPKRGSFVDRRNHYVI